MPVESQRTKEAVIRNWVRIYGKATFYVYQFPKGHWAACTPESPVGKALEQTGFIYPELDCKAQQWLIIN